MARAAMVVSDAWVLVVLMIEPYFSDEQTTIYLGDCREIFPQLGQIDAVVTDPPYGIGESSKKAKTRSKLCEAGRYHDFNWDTSAPDGWFLSCLLSRSQNQIIFGGNYFSLPPSSCWLVWDKENGANDFADCELAWTNLKRAVRRLKYRWNGMLQEPGRPKEFRLYPTQKPIAVMEWALSYLPDEVALVCDPFCGSGSTLIAARKAGMKSIGIDRDERAVEIAAKTISGEIARYRA